MAYFPTCFICKCCQHRKSPFRVKLMHIPNICSKWIGRFISFRQSCNWIWIRYLKTINFIQQCKVILIWFFSITLTFITVINLNQHKFRLFNNLFQSIIKHFNFSSFAVLLF